MPGYNVLAGADLTGAMGLLHHPEHPPRIFLNSFYYVIGDQVLRFFVTGDKRFDSFDLGQSRKGPEMFMRQAALPAWSNNLLSEIRQKHGVGGIRRSLKPGKHPLADL